MASVSTKYYPFAKCLHPRVVTNPYTNDKIVATCGCCPACLGRKMQSNEMKCKLEAQGTIFTMFVTLTYDNASVPRLSVRFKNCKKYNHIHLIDNTARFRGLDVGELDLGCNLSVSDLKLLQHKLNLRGDIPYLSKYDLRNFIKRFRFYANKNYDAKVRYYAVGEYGPVHYRPHYHVLLFFDSKQLCENFGEILSKSWKFGRIDYSLSEGSCAQYTTSYTNSYLCVPSLLKAPQIRPFCVHSFFLGMGNFEACRETIYETPFRDIVDQVIPLGSARVQMRPTVTFFRYFFPKCKGFFEKSDNQLLNTYKLYKYACEELGDVSPMEIAKYVYSILHCNPKLPDSSVSPFAYVLNYFSRQYPHVSLISYDDEDAKKCIYRIYTELRVSRHFLNYCCSDIDTSYNYAVMQRIRIFQELYKFMEKESMLQSLLWQEQNDDSYEMFKFFYTNYPEIEYREIENTNLYRRYYTDVHNNFDNAIKHKKLNDLNEIFNNM